MNNQPRKTTGKMFYIYSTLANDQRYTKWGKSPGDINFVIDSVLIKGGAGVANKLLVTPNGVLTKVTEDELAILESNHQFKMHVEKGFIKVDKRAVDIDKVVSDMNRADPSTPRHPVDYPKEGEGATVREAA